MNFSYTEKEAEIKKYVTDESNITVIHTDEKVDSEDEPVRAIRRKKQASMVLAAQAVKKVKQMLVFLQVIQVHFWLLVYLL